MNEIKTSVEFLTAVDAVSRIPDKSRMMVGGFGRTGTPEHLLQAIIEKTKIDGLTIISNNINETSNLHHLFMQGRIRKAIGSYYTTSKEVVKAYREGRIDIELLPQGTLSEALRLGGSGIPAFYTPTSAGTELAKDKETRVFNGREYVLEESLTAEIALIRAHKADKAGNLIYRKSARNFNPLMAMAADLTIVEVDEVVELGELDPEEIITPFLFVDIVVERGKDND